MTLRSIYFLWGFFLSVCWMSSSYKLKDAANAVDWWALDHSSQEINSSGQQFRLAHWTHLISRAIYLPSEPHAGLPNLMIFLLICQVESIQTQHINVSPGVFYAQLSQSLTKTRLPRRIIFQPRFGWWEKKNGPQHIGGLFHTSHVLRTETGQEHCKDIKPNHIHHLTWNSTPIWESLGVWKMCFYGVTAQCTWARWESPSFMGHNTFRVGTGGAAARRLAFSQKISVTTTADVTPNISHRQHLHRNSAISFLFSLLNDTLWPSARTLCVCGWVTKYWYFDIYLID